MPFEIYFGQGHYADELQKISDSRISRYCSMAYLANFYYTVCGEYGDAITVCNEVIEVIDSMPWYDLYFHCSLDCDGGWAVRFDDDIQ